MDNDDYRSLAEAVPEAWRLAHWERIGDPRNPASAFGAESQYQFVQPIRDAEASRANPSRFNNGDGIKDTRPGLTFLWPVDFAAIEAEFELDWGMEWFDAPFTPMLYSQWWGFTSAHREPGPEQLAARAAWWAAWEANPRPKVQLHNPYRKGSARMYGEN